MEYLRCLVLLLGFLLALSLAYAGESGEDAGRVVVRPIDTGQALNNPDMGWIMMFYSNVPANYGATLEPADSLDWFPGCSVVYLRLPWAYIEPEEGQFNWAMLDTPAQRWIARGKRVALRITCSESWLHYATPEWVKNAGARGVEYDYGKGPTPGGQLWDPVFDDPIFLKKLDTFLTALAARYDGNPNIAFIDVGSYGLWGEGHTLASSQLPERVADPIIRKHIDLYAKHFRHTLLCINDDVVGPERPGNHFPLSDYALAKGMTLRDDSILVQPPPKSWFHADMAQAFWPNYPVILEHEHYGGSKSRGAWGNGALLRKAVEDYHASYLSIHWTPQEFFTENRSLIAQINQRLGYRLQLRAISWPATMKIGDPFSVEQSWANAGVAPCYPGGFAALTLKDTNGGIVSVLVDEGMDVRTLEVGAPGKVPVKTHRAQFRIGYIAPTTHPGTYDVYVSIGQRDGTPRIALPLPGDDGQHRYQLGRITLTN